MVRSQPPGPYSLRVPETPVEYDQASHQNETTEQPQYFQCGHGCRGNF